MEASFSFHLASPHGTGAVAVYELYGPGAGEALARTFRPRAGALPGPGRARVGDLVTPGGGPIDEVLVARIPAEASWLGLESWTLEVHGGAWIVQRARQLLEALGGSLLDRRGALLLARSSDRLDAIQAAALELLPRARTEEAALFLVRQAAGELSAALRGLLALVDRGEAAGASAGARAIVARSRPALRLVEPLRLLIAGPPNAGKSTLFNRLLGEERAVVSATPGTTRDTLEGELSLGGYPIDLVDGAGIRDPLPSDEVERRGIERVHSTASDAVLYLLPPPWAPGPHDRSFLERRDPDRVMVLASCADLSPEVSPPPGSARLSTHTGEGVGELLERIVSRWIAVPECPGANSLAAPFSSAQLEPLRRAAGVTGVGAGALDDLRVAFLECLERSWPR